MSEKVILTTGANRGIGLAIVQVLAMRNPGYNLIVASRKLEKAHEAIAALKMKGCTNEFYPITLDVTADSDIETAVEEVKAKFGRLDVLINNAGFAQILPNDANLHEARSTWSRIMDTNVTSAYLVTKSFLPLLYESESPRVINVSSARGSFDRAVNRKNPPSVSLGYTASKSALNMVTLEMGKTYPDIEFQAVSPGHCKTAFNSYRGTKDPLDGAKVVVNLAAGDKGSYECGFWECDDDNMTQTGW